MVLAYSAYANSRSTLFSASGSSTFSPTVNSVNALNSVGANSLVLTPTGSNSWISAANPLTVVITGNLITTYATNAAYATSTQTETQTWVLNSPNANTVSATAGNFFNITSVTISGMTLGASPSLTVQVTQNYAGVVHGAAPWTSNTANSISMSQTVNYAIISNFTTYGGGAANQFGSNIGLAIFAVIFAAIILAVISSLREATGEGESGGFL